MMQQKHIRTTCSIKNARVAMISKILAILSGYFARIVFTHTLSMEYVGINGLYMNIVGALNAMELGIGTALVYSMYEPVAAGDYSKQRALMKLYDRIYIITAFVTTCLGLLMFPILKLVLKDTGDVQGAFLIYVFFLIQNFLSYILMYRSMIFLANQRNYVNDMYDSLFLMLQNFLQIVVLLLTGSYRGYLLIYVLAGIGRNAVIYYKAGKEYPAVFEPSQETVTRQEIRTIYRNMSAMLMHKVGNVVIGNIDNLTLTGIIGLTSVGMYSNYYLIVASVRQIIDRVVYAIAGSVGNLGATEKKEIVKEVFLGSFFLIAAGYGIAGITLYHALDVFIGMSFGSEYVFHGSVAAILCINLFLNGIRQASLIFRDSLGLFWYDRYKTIVESLINIVASIILALKFGTAGVFLGTTVSIVGISMWVEPYVLYSRYFKTSCREYFGKLAKYALQFALAWLVTDLIRNLITWPNELIQLITMTFVSLLITSVIMIGFNIQTEEYALVRSHLFPEKEKTS